MNTSNKNVK